MTNWKSMGKGIHFHCAAVACIGLVLTGCAKPTHTSARVPPAASFTLEQLDGELRARIGNKKLAMKSDSGLAQLSTKDIIAALRAKQKAIYGPDDRQDYYDTTSAIKGLAASVASFWMSGDLTATGNGTYQLKTTQLNARGGLCGGSLLLCDGERFGLQPTGAFCTGFIVADNLIATAGHCVNPGQVDVTDVRVVFGYQMADASTPVTEIPQADVYSGAEVVHRMQQDAGSHWALVRVDRKFQNRSALTIRLLNKIPDNTAVMLMGHPTGLPFKFADGAAVRDNSPTAYFVANLDSFAGNSGSPVFSESGGVYQVEGILVRGEVDYVSSGSCCVALVCPNSGCRGEDVTRTTEFAQYVPPPN